MKKKLILSVILLILFLGGTVRTMAQVSGYRGLRWMAGYSLKPILDYSGKTKYPIHFGHMVQVDYTLTRKIMLGGAMEMTTVPYPIRYDGSQAEMKYKIYSINFRSKVGSRNAVFPLGKYTNMRLMVAELNLNYNKMVEKGDTVAYEPKKGRQYDFGLAIGYGQNRILFNRLVLDFGVELGFFAQASTGWNDDIGDWTIPMSRYITSTNLSRVRIGLSGLLF